MGFALVLALILLDRTGIARLIDPNTDESGSAIVFVGSIVTMFSVGATLTGLLLIMTEDS